MKKIVKIATLNMPKSAWDEVIALVSILMFVLIAVYVTL